MDRLEEWRAFATVASLKSFSQAARRLGRSPQAVTRAIAALETRLGTRLLHRTTRSVSLTSDGERYLERSKRAIAEVDALEVPVDAHAPLRGTLSVTAPVLFGQLHVMPIVTAFLATHEQMSVKVALLDRVVSLADEGIDLAVRIGELPDSALIARHVGDVRTVVVASPDYLERAGTPRMPETLTRHVCISLSATTPVSDRWTFGKRSIAVAPRLVVNTAQAAIDAAAEGLGLTRVLSYQVDRLVAAGKLKVVLASHEPRPVPVHLVHLPGARSRAAITFAELAATTLRKRLG
ncbi:MAG: LysR family transcriptional regulator [Kofleriaceae bacterium]|nr:LysR family transcriptional regulator [Kofleriaceae bacterium]